MKILNRLQHLFKLWSKSLEAQELPQYDRWLSNEFSLNKKYGSQDRRWYSEALFAAVRHGYFALFCCENLNSNALTEQSVELFKQKYSSHGHFLTALRNADVDRFFAFVFLRYCHSQDGQNLLFSWDDYCEALSAQKPLLEKYKSFFEDCTAFLQVRHPFLYFSVPLHLSHYFERRVTLSDFSTSQKSTFLNHLNTRPPLWLRLNHPSQKSELLSELQKENFTFREENDAIEVFGNKGIFNLKSYQNGLFEIQDLASQSIGKSVGVKGKQVVWDCCAGGGGKTLQIASEHQNKGVIYASDIREFKLEEVKKRAKRAQFFNVRCLPWKGEALPDFPKEIALRGGFHWVLVDAPCSSSGTWRRNPDAKYRIDVNQLSSLNDLQLKILSNASKAVMPGGHLVYATCSWLVEENEGVVTRFLEQNPHFSLVSSNLWGSPHQNADTMFSAVLVHAQNKTG
jgi:16S rRNA (cytosine967-C5)-methyltransferase